MTDILNQIGSAFGGLVDSSAVQVTARLLFLYLVLVWMATAWWAFRDLSRRTTSLPAPFLVSGLFVLATPLFFVPVAIVYRVVRPAETLAEASERDLTEPRSRPRRPTPPVRRAAPRSRTTGGSARGAATSCSCRARGAPGWSRSRGRSARGASPSCRGDPSPCP